MALKLHSEKHEQQKAHMTSEVKKYKLEIAKFRELLKNSEDQLKQC